MILKSFIKIIIIIKKTPFHYRSSIDLTKIQGKLSFFRTCLESDIETETEKSVATTNKEDNPVIERQISVDSRVVSRLVREVELLLSYLDNNDFEGAQHAAKIIKGGQTTGGEDTKDQRS